MATQPRRSGSDFAASPAPFSYAQAAKGMSSTGPSTAAPNKQHSESIPASKEGSTTPAAAPTASVPSWADDAEAEDSRIAKPSSTREAQSVASPAAPKQGNTQNFITTSGVSSPDLPASSGSTAVKDDDASSLQNASSESTSTWENKSQASTSVEKSSEPADKASEKGSEKRSEKRSDKSSEKGKGKNAGKVPFKPLQEAPIPSVNPWARRADELKAKVAQKPSPAKVAPAASVPATPNGIPQGPSAPSKKTKHVTAADNLDLRERTSTPESKPKATDDGKATQAKKDAKPELDSEKTRKGARGKPSDKDTKTSTIALPLPPDRDQESWPTPETAVDEDRKKAQGKGEKNDKERKDSSTNRPHGKQEWVTVPYTPNVIFNTPLPSTATSRRGGRGGGRGGAQTGGRGSAPVTNGVGNSEKDAIALSQLANGDLSKRGRPDTPAAREASPSAKRTGSVGSTTQKEAKSAVLAGEKNSKTTSVQDSESTSRRPSVLTEPSSGAQVPGHNSTFPRHYPPNRSNKGRRGDYVAQGERRKDSDSASPTKDFHGSHDRRTSTATQTDIPEDRERRASTFQDGMNGTTKSGSNDRRPFGSISGRERGRGGGRGGRGAYQNGHHQFTNGHTAPMQSSSTFPLRSPTTFHPDQAAYFPSTPTHGRNYRNGPRSQSITTENMYGRAPGYTGGSQQIPPIQTYMGGMYDYPMIHPMSAMPYSPYGVDQATLFSMVTTQLEYYFSVENLCKDIFLRKYMDSKGFVYLSFIADFNRIKQLTTDMELIRYVCYQSNIIEFRVGVDGKDRLRRREGWEQWVMGISERDPSAQNDGPEELHHPPIPHPQGFEQTAHPQYTGMLNGSSNGLAHYPLTNGVHVGDTPESSTGAPDDISNDASGGVNGFAGSNGHPIESSTKAVSGEPDSFSDEQVATLSVIVRKQEQTQAPTLPPSASRTFSNGSIDSKRGVPDDSDNMNGRQSPLKVNGTSPSQGFESQAQDGPRRTLSPFAPPSVPPLTPVRLYWVKGKDAPVESLPLDSTYESYTHLRFKALEQRKSAALGSCPHDMDVLYQFWSHFLIRNFNLQMYEEFRHLAFEDSAHQLSDIGLTNLIKFYGESLLSPQNLVRERVARHYVELVKSENENQRPALRQLRAALQNDALDPRNRKRIDDLLDSELQALLE